MICRHSALFYAFLGQLAVVKLWSRLQIQPLAARDLAVAEGGEELLGEIVGEGAGVSDQDNR